MLVVARPESGLFYLTASVISNLPPNSLHIPRLLFTGGHLPWESGQSDLKATDLTKMTMEKSEGIPSRSLIAVRTSAPLFCMEVASEGSRTWETGIRDPLPESCIQDPSQRQEPSSEPVASWPGVTRRLLLGLGGCTTVSKGGLDGRWILYCCLVLR